MTKHDKVVRENAFRLYAAGIPMERIAKKLEISKVSLYKWKEDDNWGERSKEINRKVIEKANETLTEIKDKQHQVIKGIIGTFARDLSQGKIVISPSELMAAMKHELHLMGEAETSTKIDGELTADDFAEAYERLKNKNGHTNSNSK